MGDITASAKAQDEIVAEKKGGMKPNQVTEQSLNLDELRHIADLVTEYGFTDFEYENESIRVRLSKLTAAPVVHATPAAQASTQSTAGINAGPSAAPASDEVAVDPDAGLYKITSPIVGTFYRSPGPDKSPFVTEGSIVSPETTVCIVEAMKLMNEIQAEVSGEVVRVYVENGQPIEYGQALFGIKK